MQDGTRLTRVTRRQALAIVGGATALLAGVPLGWSVHTAVRFPSDRTPEGCYLRIALALSKTRVADCFAYLETASQHALFTIHDFRKKSLARIRASFEEPERTRLIDAYGPEGDVAGPPELWVVLARQRGWDARMRRDLSGIRAIETAGDRATIVTAQGTRYPLRRGDNGLWGLTLFTAELVEHKERCARDAAMVERVADDYDRARRPR
jgi:hypothetical protein